MWLWHLLGFDYGLPYGHVGAYNVWSGFGSDVGEVVIFGGAYTLLRKHMCHQGRCWRVGRHNVDGTPWCNRHHEAARPAAAQPKTDPVPQVLAQLRDEIHDLAEATRAAVKP